MSDEEKHMTLEQVAQEFLNHMIAEGGCPAGTTIKKLLVRESTQQARIMLSNGEMIEFEWRLPDQPQFGDEH